MRIQEQLAEAATATPAFVAASNRLRELARTLPTEWRQRLARAPIEKCDVKFEIACPLDWGSLAPTTRDDERHCGACQKVVRYCTTIEQARSFAQSGRCVALDLTLVRAPGDLDKPLGRSPISRPPTMMGAPVALPQPPKK